MNSFGSRMFTLFPLTVFTAAVDFNSDNKSLLIFREYRLEPSASQTFQNFTLCIHVTREYSLWFQSFAACSDVCRCHVWAATEVYVKQLYKYVCFLMYVYAACVYTCDYMTVWLQMQASVYVNKLDYTTHHPTKAQSTAKCIFL